MSTCSDSESDLEMPSPPTQFSDNESSQSSDHGNLNAQEAVQDHWYNSILLDFNAFNSKCIGCQNKTETPSCSTDNNDDCVPPASKKSRKTEPDPTVQNGPEIDELIESDEDDLPIVEADVQLDEDYDYDNDEEA